MVSMADRVKAKKLL